MAALAKTTFIVKWSGKSGWWLIETIESFNGQRYVANHSNYIKWFSGNAFGGINYSNTPIGAVSHTDEPGLPSSSYSSTYFGLWVTEKKFRHLRMERQGHG